MKFERSTVITLVVLVAIVVCASVVVLNIQKKSALSPERNKAAQAFVREPDQAPFTDMQGGILSLEDYVGSIVVATSWASWCPDCTADLQTLAVMNDQYGDVGVQILAINRAENAYTAQRYLQSVIESDALTLVLDPDDRYYQTINGYTMPETVIYSQTGEIVYHKRGPLSRSELDEVVQGLIAE